MIIISIILSGVLFSVSMYLILQRHLISLLFGFSLFNHAANLFILTVSGNPIGKTEPIVSDLSKSYVDPIPQALLLTAIVIGFGVTAYLIVLLYKIYKNEKTAKIKEIYE